MTDISSKLEYLHSQLCKCVFPIGLMLVKRKLQPRTLEEISIKLRELAIELEEFTDA